MWGCFKTMLVVFFTNASVNTMAVVVPSPARVAVLSAACFIILTARFSTGSRSSMDLATVTPSLVTVILAVCWGDSIRTVFPLGPRVLFTAFAIFVIPLINFSRPSFPKSSSLGMYPDSFI